MNKLGFALLGLSLFLILNCCASKTPEPTTKVLSYSRVIDVRTNVIYKVPTLVTIKTEDQSESLTPTVVIIISSAIVDKRFVISKFYCGNKGETYISDQYSFLITPNDLLISDHIGRHYFVFN